MNFRGHHPPAIDFRLTTLSFAPPEVGREKKERGGRRNAFSIPLIGTTGSGSSSSSTAALLSPGIRLSGITSGKNWRESNEIKWRRSGNKGVEVVYGKIRRRKT